MIVKATKENIEEGLKLMNLEKNKELTKYFFLEYSNQPDILKKIDPQQHKEYKAKLKSIQSKKIHRYKSGGGNKNKIVDAFKVWKKCGFFDIKIFDELRKGKGNSNYPYPTKKYRLNLKPFFEFFNEKFKKRILSQGEQKFISFIFSFQESREIVFQYEELFSGILTFLEEVLTKRYPFYLEDSSTLEFLPNFNSENLAENFAKSFFVDNNANRRYLDKKEGYFDQAIYKFLSDLGDKIKPKKIDYRPLWYNEDLRDVDKRIPPIDILEVIDNWAD